MSDGEAPQRPRLRERKKAKTRAAIRECALRLFREQGYDATTVDQIAQAAEVSPSTFFRYFATKEEVVLADEYDPLIFEAFAAQPAALSPAQALRGALRSVFGGMSAAERLAMRQQVELTQSVPALRAGFLDELAQAVRTMADMVAQRVGRDPGDVAVRAFAGAVLGVLIAVYVYWAENPDSDLFAALDLALAQLEAGLPL